MSQANLISTTGLAVTQEFLDNLRSRTTQELKEILTQQLTLTVEHLTRLAWVVKTLEDRGEDLSSFRMPGLINHLRLIAGGQVLPDVVVKFAGRPELMGKISSLPQVDQQRLAAGESVKVVVLDGQGGFTHRMMEPAKLTRDQVAQVFGRAHLRSESEQIAMIESRRLKPAASKATPARGKARADRTRNGLIVNRTFVSAVDVVSAMADLKPVDAAEDTAERSQVGLTLSEQEHAKLKHAAVDAQTNVSDLVRRALRAYGLI